MNSNPNQNPQQPNENVPYPPSSYSYDPYHNSNIPSTDPYQYPPNAPNLVPPPPPGVYPPYASDDPTAPSRFRTYYGMYPTTSPSTRRSSFTRRTLLIMVVLLVLLIGIGAALFIPYQNAQNDKANATATAQTKATSIANAATATASTKNATATAITNAATATAQANVFATATAVTSNTNPYPPNQGTLVLNDPLNNTDNNLPNNGNCTFTGSAYHVGADKGYYDTCVGGASYTNFAFEVQMTVLKGDCGGMMFRTDNAKGWYYLFETCANGDYGVFMYFGPGGNDYKTVKISHSPAVKTGLNQVNVIAVVANGKNFNLYVNRQAIDSFSDGSYSSGQTGFVVDSSGVLGGPAASTEVAYNYQKVWTF